MSDNATKKLFAELKQAKAEESRCAFNLNRHEELNAKIGHTKNLEAYSLKKYQELANSYEANTLVNNEKESLKIERLMIDEKRRINQLKRDRASADKEQVQHVQKHGTYYDQAVSLSKAKEKTANLVKQIEKDREQVFGSEYVKQVNAEQSRDEKQQKRKFSPEVQARIDEREERDRKEREQEKGR